MALAACGSRGYSLAGSLAMQVHGVADARESNDIDLFVNELLDDADTVRQDVTQALRAAGYHVEQVATWGVTDGVTAAQNGELAVSHPDHGTVNLQMVCVTRYLMPVDRDGMPVTAIGECLYRKIEALQNRLGAKDFLDLALLRTHMGQVNTDRYIGMYVTGLAQHQGRPESELRQDLYQAFAQVAQIPDEPFAAYGYTPAHTVELRTAILTWADDLAPESNPMRRDAAIASGHLPITHHEAQAALTRMAHSPSTTRLSDQQLSSWRAAATSSLLRAMSTRQSTQHAQQQLHPISDELERRAQLTPHERAAEDTVRRAEEAERAAGGDPGRLGPRGILARLKPTPTPTASPRPGPSAEQHLRAHQDVQPHPGRQV
ncbi:nucleotidyl transferase AbiEii/AbiGii toxin family protein [Streptomyces xinghaiensis]|nr:MULTISPECIES: nucleotidyl transferase AbiEii/AbiGii toxin family protein [Streptomyces]